MYLTIIIILLLIAIIFIPEILFLMLVLIPIIKYALLAIYPIFRTYDITFMTYLLFMLVGVSTFIKKSGNVKFKLIYPTKLIFLMVLIALLMLIGLSFTTAPVYGLQKTRNFIFICIPFLIMPSLYIRSIRDGMRIVYVFMLLCIIIPALLIISPHSDLTFMHYGNEMERASFLGSDPNFMATLCSLGLLSLIIICIIANKKKLYYALAIIFPLDVFAIFMTGSRTALISLIMSLILLPFILKRKVFKYNIIILLLIILSFAAILNVINVENKNYIPTNRWSSFFSNTESTVSSNSRMLSYSFCLNNWINKPFVGHGPGSFAYDMFNIDKPIWPHNLILEALYELGLIGLISLVLFFYFVFLIIRKGLRIVRNDTQRIIVSFSIIATLYMFVLTMTHNDLENARFFYLFVGILWANIVQIGQMSLKHHEI